MKSRLRDKKGRFISYKPDKFCKDCGKKLDKYSKSIRCMKCYAKTKKGIAPILAIEKAKIKNKGGNNGSFKKGHIPKNYNKGKGFINKHGYKEKVINKKRILESHIIWCKYNHPYVPEGYVIHHIDGNKLNNSPNNLVLMSRSDHAKLHNKLRRIGG